MQGIPALERRDARNPLLLPQCQVAISLEKKDPPPIEQNAGDVEQDRAAKQKKRLGARQSERIKHKRRNNNIDDKEGQTTPSVDLVEPIVQALM